MDLLQEGPPIGFKRCFKRIHWLSKEEFSWSPFETRRAGGTGCCLRSTGRGRAHKGVSKSLMDKSHEEFWISKILKSALYFTDNQRSESRIGEIRSCYLEFVGGLAAGFRMSYRLRPYDKVQNTMSGKNQVKMIWRRGRSLKDQPGSESFWPWIIKTENRAQLNSEWNAGCWQFPVLVFRTAGQVEGTGQRASDSESLIWGRFWDIQRLMSERKANTVCGTSLASLPASGTYTCVLSA